MDMNNMTNPQLIQIDPSFSRADVFELIDHAAKNLRRIERMTVSEAGLSPPQYHLLRSLWEHDRMPLKDLAKASNCSRATITGLIDGLEEKGLVRRVPNPEDRRSLLAELTETGRALREHTHALQSVYSECCEGLAPNQFQQLGVLLARLNYSLS
jgi:DNA-binding MarR family transcriptional regulator